MKKIIAIDPGINGGIAWIDDDIVQAIPMPEGMTSQADLLKEIVTLMYPLTRPIIGIIEKTGTYKPGNSGIAAVTFARHCGNLEAILYMLPDVSTSQVSPQIWQKLLGSLPKEKLDRKREIKEKMARLYPHLTVTLKTSDALGILTWASRLSY